MHVGCVWEAYKRYLGAKLYRCTMMHALQLPWLVKGISHDRAMLISEEIKSLALAVLNASFIANSLAFVVIVIV